MEKWITVSKKTFDIFCHAKKLDGKEHWHYYEMKDPEGKIQAFFQHGFIVNRYKIIADVEENFREATYDETPKDLLPLRDFFKDKEW
jgi:hypothetical protein